MMGKTTTKSWGAKLSNVQNMQVHELFYYAAFILWTSLMIVNSSFYAKYLYHGIYNGVRLFCFMLLFLSELSNARKTPQSIAGISIALVLGYAVWTSAETVLFDCIALIYCARNKDFRTIAVVALVLTTLLVSFIIASSFAGIILNYTGWSGGRTRSYLGFRYALFPAQYIYLITCLVIYLLGDGFRLSHAAALLGVNYYVYATTLSRLSYYMSVGIIVCSVLLAIHNRRSPKDASESRRERFTMGAVLLALTFISCAVFSVILASRYDPMVKWMADLDGVRVLGGRLQIGHNALRSYPIKPFGRELHFSGAALRPDGTGGDSQNYNTIDCLYIRALICYGYVFTGIYLVLMTIVLLRAHKEGNQYLVIILIGFALRGVIDNLSLYLHYNTFLLLMGCIATEEPFRRFSIGKYVGSRKSAGGSYRGV